MKLKINNTKETTIRKANQKINSYITTIPIDIIKLTELEANDKIIWHYNINPESNELNITIDFKKATSTDEDAEDPEWSIC